MNATGKDPARVWLIGASLVLLLQCHWVSGAGDLAEPPSPTTIDVAQYYDMNEELLQVGLHAAKRQLLQSQGSGLTAQEIMALLAKYPCENGCSGHGKCLAIPDPTGVRKPLSAPTIHGRRVCKNRWPFPFANSRSVFCSQ